MLASDLLVDSLDLVLGGNPSHVEVDEALPIKDTPETVRADALDTLLGFTTALLNNEHALRCAADQPPALIRKIHGVTCPDCVPGDDIRTAIRYARRPTRYAGQLFAEDDVHWLRVFALVGAASAGHLDDPYGLARVLLED